MRQKHKEILAFETHLAIAQGSEETAQGRRLSLRALIAETVEQIGGSIWLESEHGTGTTFHLTVVDPPLARED